MPLFSVMNRSKKIFLALSAVFFVLLFYASYDISRRTTFPGSRPQLKERVQQKLAPGTQRSTAADSAAGRLPPNTAGQPPP